MRFNLQMLMLVMMAFATTAAWGEDVETQTAVIKIGEVSVELREASEHEEIEIAALEVAEMAERGLIKDLWSDVSPQMQQEMTYGQFEVLVTFIKKMVNPAVSRRPLISGFVDKQPQHSPAGQYAIVAFCTRSGDLDLLEFITLKQDSRSGWSLAGYQMFMSHLMVDGPWREQRQEKSPCELRESERVKAGNGDAHSSAYGTAS